MKIFLDTADVSFIQPAYETGLIDGVTTNPSLILKSGRQLLEVIQELSKFQNLQSISAEVVAETAEEMLSEAQKFYSIAPAVTIKVPCTVEGLKACKFLSDKGIQTNVTLVFSVAQAILASKAGATFISPFVGRWMDNSIDGVEIVKNIRKAFDYSVLFSGECIKIS
jgi:transaldolase